MNYLSRSFIILFSEAIWVYYGIALLTSIEMDKAVFVNAIWWLVAGIVGYAFNMIFAGRVHYLVLIGGNVLLLGLIIIQNMKSVSEASWVFGLVLGIAVSFIFIRSGSFVYREPKRLQILNRFEGNILSYAFLAFVFTTNGWGDERFHFVFLFATFISLIGMTLTLQNQGQDEGHGEIEVQRVGHSGWFTAVVSILLIIGTLVCALLFLPFIREAIYKVAMNGVGLLKWLTNNILEFIAWLFSLFPDSKTGRNLPEITAEELIMPEEKNGEVMFVFPLEWFAGILGVIVLVIGFIVLTKFLKQWQPPKPKKRQQVVIVKGSWWISFQKVMKAFFKWLAMKWRYMFPRYYKQTVYWYYNQVEKWGKKNGFRRLRSETSAEYVEKVINYLAVEKNASKVEINYDHLSSLLRKISQDYQATYYGKKRKTSESDYQLLLKELKGLQLNRKLAVKDLDLKRKWES